MNCNTYFDKKIEIKEAICLMETKINELVEMYNRIDADHAIIAEKVAELEKLIDYLLGAGLEAEVKKKLEEWLADGTLADIINETVFEDLNAKINALIKKEYYITPQCFGAVGDGIEDDTQAINDACATGLPVIFPKTNGHYKISAPIIVKNSMEFFGELVMYGANGDENHRALIIDGLSNIEIKNPLIDLQWNGSVVKEQDHAIYIINSENIRVNGGEIKNCPGDNIYVGKNSKNVTVESCKLFNAYRCNFAVTSGSNISIKKCYIESKSQYVSNIDIEPNTALDICENITIEDNKIINKDGTNLFISILREGTIKNVKVLNNTFEATKRNITSLYKEIGEVLINGNTFVKGSEAMRINANFDKITLSNNNFGTYSEPFVVSFGKPNLPRKSGLLIIENNSFKGNLITQRSHIQDVDTLIFNGNLIDGFKTLVNEVIGSFVFQDITNITCNNNIFKNVVGYAIGINKTIVNGSLLGNVVSFDDTVNSIKGFVRTGPDTVIKNLKTNNSVSKSATIGWTIWNGATVPPNEGDYSLNKTVYGDQANLPKGTYNVGDLLINTGVGNVFYKCSTAGTVGTLVGLTGTKGAGTSIITLSDISKVSIGEYIKIGPFTRKIVFIQGNDATLETAISSSYVNEAVTYATPTMV